MIIMHYRYSDRAKSQHPRHFLELGTAPLPPQWRSDETAPIPPSPWLGVVSRDPKSNGWYLTEYGHAFLHVGGRTELGAPYSQG